MNARLPVPDRGQRFGRLTVLSQEITIIGGRQAVPCRCDCGEERLAGVGSLLGGRIRSCGKCNRGAQFATWINSPENAERLRRLHGDPEYRAKRAERVRSAEYKAKQREAQTSHGLSRHPLYGTWRNMMYRCDDPACKSYENYGGRGIGVSDQWRDLTTFIMWIEENLGPRPDGMTLDRIDNDGHYEPGNVRWATPTEQAANRRKRRTSRGNAA